MELSELIAYAREKYQIEEQHNWPDVPGLSILCHPQTGKWAALLMRQWDTESGTVIERCDLKCGMQSLAALNRPYLSPPLRMHGSKWINVAFGSQTEPEVVFSLFDKAVASGNQRGFTLVLDPVPFPDRTGEPEAATDPFSSGRTSVSDDASDPFLSDRMDPLNAAPDPFLIRKGFPDAATAPYPGQTGVPDPFPIRKGFPDAARSGEAGQGPQDRPQRDRPCQGAAYFGRNTYRDTPLPSAALYLSNKGLPPQKKTLPEKIRQLRQLYEPSYGWKTSSEKAGIFRRQAKFMEDYEEDGFSLPEDFTCYFPTYQELTTNQLRGYFFWRTLVRKGEFRPVATSAAYLYIYELLNGIGAQSLEDSLQKLKAFEEGYLDSGIGDKRIQRNLRNWMLELSVVHGLPPETARQYADPEILERDGALSVLRSPKEHTDEEIFSSLCFFCGKKLLRSPIFGTDEDKEKGEQAVSAFPSGKGGGYPAPAAPAFAAGQGRENPSKGVSPAISGAQSVQLRGRCLLAKAWRKAASGFQDQGKSLFTLCFGRRITRAWHPLYNAVYDWQGKPADREYQLDACRIYRCRNGEWQRSAYEKLYFDKDRLQSFLHEAERRLRLYLKTGGRLREKPSEAWAAPFIEAVIQEDREAAAKAAKPKIAIDLSGLEQIRKDALATLNSLLTQEERLELEGTPGAPTRAGDVRTAQAEFSWMEESPGAPIRTGGGFSAKEEDLDAEKKPEAEPCVQVDFPRAVKPFKLPVRTGDSLPVQKEVLVPEKKPEAEFPAQGTPGHPARAPEPPLPLDALQVQILRVLLRSGSADRILKENGLMPSIAADALSEALFDEIGDAAVLCEDDRLFIAEDYREEIARLLGE